jgi:hypothetical protein
MAEFHIKTSESGKLQGPFSSGQLNAVPVVHGNGLAFAVGHFFYQT